MQYISELRFCALYQRCSRGYVFFLPFSLSLSLNNTRTHIISGTTHSLCTLEFIPNNELYEWVLDAIELEKENRVFQAEFARLNLTYTISSKRVLRGLVESGVVSGFDDPRLATFQIRRRGVPSSSIVEFVNSIGVAKVNSFVDIVPKHA